ncbi:MAG: hypothetical protein ACJA01_004239 [Saprospiraceae bacterium]|jgi:hypothetical protein
MNILLRLKKASFCLLLLLCWLGFPYQAYAQDIDPCDDPNAVRVYLPDTLMVKSGENICIPIFVDNFNNIVQFLFSVNISSTTLQYTEANTLTSGLPSFTSSDVVDLDSEPDILRVLWAAPNVVGETLPNGTILLELCFNVVGTPGVDGAIFINDAGLNSSIDFIADDPVTGQSIALPVCPDQDPPIVHVMPPDTPNPLVYLTSACGTSGGFDNGVAEISIFNGTPPYSIADNLGNTFNLPDGQNIQVFANLPQGTRTYIVTDATGMVSDPMDISITDISPFTIGAVVRPPRCPEDNNGRINLTVSGGRPFEDNKYYFDWGPELVGVDQVELTMVGNGSYNIVIRDSLGCTQDTVIEVLREEIQIVIDDVNNAFCPGRENGQIIVSATGGGPFNGDEYIYSLTGITNDGTPYDDSRVNPATSGTFVTIPAGRYVVTAIDSIGRGNCDLNPSDTIIVDYSRAYMATITGGDVMGCTLGMERAMVSISGGNGAQYDYTVTDDTGATVDSGSSTDEDFFTNCLSPGTYNINISDDQTCGMDTTFSLVGCDLSFFPLGIEPSCFGETDGTILLNASSTNGTITYQWSTGDSTDRVDNLAAGDYSVTMTDFVSCQITEIITLFEPESFTVDFTITPIPCSGGFGSITAIPVGGEEPYTYFWDPDPNGIDNEVLADIVSGTYYVTVEDDDECRIVDSIMLSNPIPPMAAVTNLSAPRCEGDPSGAAVIVVTPNQTYTGPFSFISNTGLQGGPNNFAPDNFTSGTNWVIITDDPTGCIFDTIFVEIPDAPPLAIDFNASTIGTIECFGGSDLEGATVNLVGTGASGIDFTWPDGSVGNVQLGLRAGIYPVTLTSGSCMSVDTFILTQPDSLGIFVDQNASIFAACSGEMTNIVLGRIGGAAGLLSWDWRDANGATITRDSFFNDIAIGSYNVIATDQNNCQVALDFDVTGSRNIGLVLGEITQPLCFGDFGTIRMDSAFGGSGSFRYQVNTSPAQDLDQPFEAPSGDYTIRVFDSNGCSADTMIIILTPEELIVSLGDDIEVQLGETGSLTATINSSSAIDMVNWDPADITLCNNAECSQVTISPITSQTFRAQVIDVNGCQAIDIIQVNVVRSENVYVPNVFQPLSLDPANRSLKVYTGAGVEFIDFLKIFDRWGNLVHIEENLLPETNGAGNWTGDFNGNELNPGVFVYVVQVRFLGITEPSVRRGDVTLIR